MADSSRSYAVPEGLRTPILATGIVLVGIGAVMLIYLGMMVIKILNTPEDVRIVQFVLENVTVDERALSGHVGEQEIEIHFSESMRSVMFLFLGVAVFGVLAGVMKALIGGGAVLIKLAAAPRPEPPERPTTDRHNYEKGI